MFRTSRIENPFRELSNFGKLLDYEWRPTLSGICQYHRDLLLRSPMVTLLDEALDVIDA